MTKEQEEIFLKLPAVLLKSPVMRKLILAQLAASVAPGFNYGALDDSEIAENAIGLADEILKQVGL